MANLFLEVSMKRLVLGTILGVSTMFGASTDG